MSMDRCADCERLVDTDEDVDCYMEDDRCVCEFCREKYPSEEAEYYAELNRGYSQDRI